MSVLIIAGLLISPPMLNEEENTFWETSPGASLQAATSQTSEEDKLEL